MINWLSDYLQSYPLTATVQLMALPTYLLCFWVKKKYFLILNIVTSFFYAAGYICMYAWSGFILAVMTASICLIVFFLNKNADESEVKKRKWVLLVVFGFTNVVISTIFESKIIAVVMVVASLLNYYNYFFMKENDQKTKIIFIISHMFIITYEIVVELYFFALMDFIATLSIIGALIITQYFHQKSHHFHRRLKHKEKGMEGITCQVNSGKSED